MEKPNIVQRATDYVGRTLVTVLDRCFPDSLRNSSVFRSYQGQMDGIVQLKDNELQEEKQARQTAQTQVSTNQTELEQLTTERDELRTRNTSYLLERIGFEKEARRLENELALKTKEADKLRTSARISLRKEYDSGTYRKRAVLLADSSSVVSLQNVCAKRLLGFNLHGTKISDFIPIDPENTQLAKIGDVFYRFEFTQRGEGYEVEVTRASQRDQKFYGESNAPHKKIIPVIVINKIPATA